LLSAQLIGSYDADSLILISKAVSTTNSFSGNDTETINDVEHDAKQALSFWHTKKRKKKKTKQMKNPRKYICHHSLFLGNSKPNTVQEIFSQLVWAVMTVRRCDQLTFDPFARLSCR